MDVELVSCLFERLPPQVIVQLVALSIVDSISAGTVLQL